MNKKRSKIGWKSKFVDLLIVIIGITIAFQLNNINENKKSEKKEIEYIKSLNDENKLNIENLRSELEYSLTSKSKCDSLMNILENKKFDEPQILDLSTSMLGISDFHPSLTAMENITASGDFELIRDVELRKKIIDVYHFYNSLSKLEEFHTLYAQKYVTPYFFDNFRFRDLSPTNEDFAKDHQLENIVIGFNGMLVQKINGYQKCMDLMNVLDDALNRN